MMKYVLIFLSINIYALSFNDAMNQLLEHNSIKAYELQSRSLESVAKSSDAWDEPILKLSAKNYPVESFSYNQTPMSGIELSISQKVPLTNKLEIIQKSSNAIVKAYQYKTKSHKEFLVMTLWQKLIAKRKISDEIAILQDNKEWIKKMLEVSNQLYAIGKVSQQAILDMQIRKSQITSMINTKEYESMQIDDDLQYLVGESSVEPESIPWDAIADNISEKHDYNALQLEQQLKAKEYQFQVAKLDQIADATFSFGYTKRSNIDNVGDFVSASVSFPLSWNDKKRSFSQKQSLEKEKARLDYEEYKSLKKRDISLARKEIEKFQGELEIVKKEMIGFAKDAREVTSKSYSVGKASYVELLQSELHLQEIMLKKVRLHSQIDLKRVYLKFLQGELYNEK